MVAWYRVFNYIIGFGDWHVSDSHNAAKERFHTSAHGHTTHVPLSHIYEMLNTWRVHASDNGWVFCECMFCTCVVCVQCANHMVRGHAVCRGHSRDVPLVQCGGHTVALFTWQPPRWPGNEAQTPHSPAHVMQHTCGATSKHNNTLFILQICAIATLPTPTGRAGWQRGQRRLQPAARIGGDPQHGRWQTAGGPQR